MAVNPLADPSARIVIAHRGASSDAAENTMAAFALAAALGVDGFELDVRRSADGVAVVVHDPTLERTTSLRGPVAARTAVELARVEIPSLAEVLDAFPSMAVLIEVKETEVQSATADAIRRANASARCVMASAHHRALADFRVPPFLVGASGQDISRAWFRALVGLGPRGRHAAPDYVCASVPWRHGGLTVPSRRFVNALHTRGVAVHVWTVDDEATALLLWRRGVNGIVTNHAARILQTRSHA